MLRINAQYAIHHQYSLSSPQPSHGDSAANPKVLKWMTDLTKIRKQLKGKSSVSVCMVVLGGVGGCLVPWQGWGWLGWAQLGG